MSHVTRPTMSRVAICSLRTWRNTGALLHRPRATTAQPTAKRSYTSSIRSLASHSAIPRRQEKSEADLLLEDLEEQYATAQDEYEIALEETQNGTVYAEDDRRAAKEQIEKVLQNYITVMKSENHEIATRLSTTLYEKIKCLAEDIERLEEMATAHD